MKDKAFVPPQPVSIPDLKNRITAAVETITPDLLSRVWHELDHRLDVCRVTKGAYIEHLYVCVINLLSYSFIYTSIYNSVHHTCEYNQLQTRSNNFDTPCLMYWPHIQALLCNFSSEFVLTRYCQGAHFREEEMFVVYEREGK